VKAMKKIISMIIVICMLFCFSGCVVSGSKNYSKNTNNRLLEVPGQQDLYYDVNTKVVYIIFSEFDGPAGYGYMSPYYADNGFPYVYNAASGALEEIDVVEKMIKW
jgi:hypothetical protein